MSCTITYKGKKYSEEQFKEYFINNKQEFTTSIAKNKDVIDSFKRKMEGIDFIFSQSPELASIGSKAQYLQYLSTIFKTSKVKDIVYHGTRFIFDKFDKSRIGVSTLGGKAFYFTTNFKSAEHYAWNDMYEDGSSQGHFVKYTLLNIKNPAYNFQISDINISLEEGQIENLKQNILGKIQKIGRIDTQGTFFPGSLPHSFFTVKFNKDNTAYLVETYVDNKKTTLIELENGRKKLDKKTYTRNEFLNISENKVKDLLNVELQKANKLVKNYNKKITAIEKTKTPSYTKENDGVIQDNGKTNEYVVFEPEQIHILGSKQDIEGFKEFLSDTQKTEDYFNEEIKKIQKESKTIDEKISKFESTQKIDNKNTSKALQNMQEKVKIIGDKLLSLGFESINEKEHDFKTSSYITFKSKLKELENLDIDINTFKSPDYLIKTKIKSFKNNFNSQKQGELPFNPIELKLALKENEFIKDIADNTFEGLTDEQIKILKENLDKGEFNLNCKI